MTQTPAPRAEDLPELLTAKEAMDLLRISRTVLWRYIRDGKVPAYRLGEGNGGLRFKRAELLALLVPVPVAGSQ